MNEVEQKVISVAATILGVSAETLTLQSSLADYAADDIDRVELAMELEDEFESELEDLDGTAAGWKTLQDIVVSFTSK